MAVREKRVGKQSASVMEQTKQAILRAALQVFADRGYESVSLRDIAEHADVAHGVIRHHFGSKDAVWRAVVDIAVAEYYAALTPLLNTVSVEQTDASLTLQAVVRTYITVSARYPEVIRLIAHEGVSGGTRLDYVVEQLLPLYAHVKTLVQQVHVQGKLRHFTPEAFSLFLAMLGSMPYAFAAYTRHVCGADILTDKQVELYAQQVIATLFGGEPAAPSA
jgi:AcrR family transcriptional regulator